ncbi:DUF5666 domain-containing protein [Granulosicoccaceae sp. 1_MG-2023]|nr:DUF5666 domain-containing protein [Granulosicoccaceae sp. 1_MG-2023]
MELRNAFTPLLLTIALAACSDSDSNDNTASTTSRTQSLPDTIAGEISARNTNDIVVNGYTLDLTGVSVLYQNTAVSPQLLVTGMPVQVSSDGDSVSEVRLDPPLAGTVSALSDDSLSVADTELQHNGLDDSIAVGDYVLVLTESKADGSLLAETVLEPDTADGSLRTEIEGAVSGLDETTMTFTLNNIGVDYSAAVIEDGTLAEGRWVEVYGDYDGSVLQAAEVDIETLPADGTTEMSGTITWVNDDATVFELSGIYTFEVSSATRFEDGTQSQLAVGSYVEVTLNGSELQEVEFESATSGSSDVSSTASLAYELSGSATLSDAGITVNGYEFVIDSRTRYDDGLSYAELDGIRVEIEGRSDGQTHYVLEIERDDNDADIDLQGPVSDNTLWGYQASDNSLSAYDGQWLELDCSFDGVNISLCKIDD